MPEGHSIGGALVLALCLPQGHHEHLWRLLLWALPGHPPPAASVRPLLDAVHDGSQRCHLLPVSAAQLHALEALWPLLCNELRGEGASSKAGVVCEGAQEGDIVAHAMDDVGVQGCAHDVQGSSARGAVRDQLADHGVIVHADLAALLHAAVCADAGSCQVGVLGRKAAGLSVAGQAASGGQEAPEGVLCVHAGLKGMPQDGHWGASEAGGQALPSCHPDHELHQVQPCHCLCHWVLHLQPRVHLQEVKVLLRIRQELHSASALIAHSQGQVAGLALHGCPRGCAEQRAGALLNHLLVAPLDAALALRQRHHIAVGVCNQLDLNVAGVLNELLHKQAVVAKAGPGLLPGQAVALPGLLVSARNAHALASAASAGLDHDRVAHLPGHAHSLLLALQRARPARDGVDLGGARKLLAADLVPHDLHGVRAGANELDASALQGAREGSIL